MPAYPEVVTADGPVAYWRLGEAAGATTAADASGNGHDGTYGAGASPGQAGGVEGEPDTAVRLDGQGAGVVTVAAPASWAPAGSFTLEAWVNADDCDGYRGLIGNTVGNLPAPFDWYLAAGTGQPVLLVGNGSNYGLVSGAAAVPAGGWHHVAVTFDAAAGTITHYLDGAANGSGPAGATPLGDGGTALILGSRADGVTAFEGRLDEVAIYDHALSAVRIEIHHGAGGDSPTPTPTPAPPPPTNLTAGQVFGSEVDLAWDDVEGVTGYQVLRGTTADVAAMTAVGDVGRPIVPGSVTFLDNDNEAGLVTGTTYYYAIRFGGPGGTGPAGDVLMVTTDATTAQVLGPAGGTPGDPIFGTSGEELTIAAATNDLHDPVVTVDWGDGSGPASDGITRGQPNWAAGRLPLTAAHTYGGIGTYTVTVTVAAAGGAGTPATATCTVAVAAGSIAASGLPVVATVNEPYTGPVARFVDATPGTHAGDYSAVIDWGDGHRSDGTVADDGSGTGGFVVGGTNTYNNATFGESGYAVKVFIHGPGGSGGYATSSALAYLGGNARPTNLAATWVGTEHVPGGFYAGVILAWWMAKDVQLGLEVQRSTNGGPFVRIGLGGTVDPHGEYYVDQESNGDAAPGTTYVYRVRTNYDQTSDWSNSAAVTVGPVRATGLAWQSTIGAEGTNNIAIFGPRGPGAETATSRDIDWGDGGPVTHVAGGDPSAPESPAYAHAYKDNGVYTLQLAADNGYASSQPVVIGNVAPSFRFPNGVPRQGAVLGKPVNLSIPFADPGRLDDHTATIDWGDGSALTTVQIPHTAAQEVAASHTYASEGYFQCRLRVDDKDHAWNTVDFTAAVFAPVVNLLTVDPEATRPRGTNDPATDVARLTVTRTFPDDLVKLDVSDPLVVYYRATPPANGEAVEEPSGLKQVSEYNAGGYLTKTRLVNPNDPQGPGVNLGTFEYTPVSFDGRSILLVSNATDANQNLTHFEYDTSGFHINKVTTTLPAVGDEGPNAGKAAGDPQADTVVKSFDFHGRVSESADAIGVRTTFTYDDPTGAVKTTTVDPFVPDLGLNLKTSFEVDGLGRTVKVTDPLNHVTKTQYVGGQYDSTISTTPYDADGTTQVAPATRVDANAAAGTVETTTLDAAGDVRSKSVVHADYAGRTLFTEVFPDVGAYTGYETDYDYDARGRQAQVGNAVGTITKTTFDALGRPYAVAVGTTQANLTRVVENEYDGGNVGDGALTAVKSFLDGHTGGGNLDHFRLTRNAYDWRDRRIATEVGGNVPGGPYPISFRVLDNLGQATEQYVYDGTGLNVDLGTKPPDAAVRGLMKTA